MGTERQHHGLICAKITDDLFIPRSGLYKDDERRTRKSTCLQKNMCFLAVSDVSPCPSRAFFVL